MNALRCNTNERISSYVDNSLNKIHLRAFKINFLFFASFTDSIHHDLIRFFPRGFQQIPLLDLAVFVSFISDLLDLPIQVQ